MDDDHFVHVDCTLTRKIWHTRNRNSEVAYSFYGACQLWGAQLVWTSLLL